MSKVKVNLIKGPQFKYAEQKAYGALYNILSKKEIPSTKEAEQKAE